MIDRLHALPTINGEPIRPHKFAGQPYPESIEQVCRNLIEQGIASGACRRKPGVHPQELSSGDLTGMANLLAEYLRK